MGVLVRTIWGSFRHAPADSSPLLTLLGANDRPFFLSGNQWRQRNNISKWLEDYGVPSWGWGRSMGNVYFRVPLEQAETTRQVLANHGISYQG